MHRMSRWLGGWGVGRLGGWEVGRLGGWVGGWVGQMADVVDPCFFSTKQEMQNAKIVILGGPHIGKTSLALRAVRDEYHMWGESTIGAAFVTHVINFEKQSINLELWDTSGQERYNALMPMYYRGAIGAIVAFQVDDATSFAQAKKWVDELRGAVTPQPIIALVATKCDGGDDVNVNKVNEGIKEIVDAAPDNTYYMATSAKANYNVHELFREMGRRALIAKSSPDSVSTTNVIKLANGTEYNDPCCQL
jgi:small GTP-binding protein